MYMRFLYAPLRTLLQWYWNWSSQWLCVHAIFFRSKLSRPLHERRKLHEFGILNRSFTTQTYSYTCIYLRERASGIRVTKMALTIPFWAALYRAFLCTRDGLHLRAYNIVVFFSSFFILPLLLMPLFCVRVSLSLSISLVFSSHLFLVHFVYVTVV